MKHLLYPICIAGALAWAPLVAADPAEDCQQMAADEAVPVEDLQDYIDECVAMMENAYPDEGEDLIPEPEEPEAGDSPPQE